ncbi:hypothetical protein ABTX81_37815 [Kitasatospora sp. NPDC097605]|uniref:hypothetical protein n=1 Tax=Kitasatospora sp. NPDC097605 TaxID=3157226 RepID=UPI00333456B3
MGGERVDAEPKRGDWEFLERVAEAWDERSRTSTDTWVPPIMAPLVREARRSTLSRFHPFTSHARLCFSDGPEYWSGRGKKLPVWIGLLPEGCYEVGRLYERRDLPGYEVLLETADPVEAVAEAERALSGF